MYRICYFSLAIALLTTTSIAWGQGCSDGCGDYGGYGVTNCGREISQADAEGLWGGYCTETCYDFSRKHHCRLGDHRRNLGEGGGFGYGAAGCCGKSECGSSQFVAGQGRGAGAISGHHRHRATRNIFSRDASGCGFGYPGGGYGNCGCGGSCDAQPANCGCDGAGDFQQGLRWRQPGGHRAQHHCGGHGHGRLFGRSAANCGACGGYFDESVGAEWGNAGIRSNVAGCGTNFCN